MKIELCAVWQFCRFDFQYQLAVIVIINFRFKCHIGSSSTPDVTYVLAKGLQLQFCELFACRCSLVCSLGRVSS